MEITEITQDPGIEFLMHQINTGFEGKPSRLYGFSGERTQALHLSDILQDLYIRLEHPKHRGETGPEAIWSMGLAWEHLLSWSWSQVFPDHDRMVHLGEFEKDGVIMTPDRVDTVWPGIVELKCTWKSARKWPISECWFWLKQAEAYCRTLELVQARFYVLHIMDTMGMYGGDPIPPKVWEVRFTQGELQRTWEMILTHRDNLLKGR